MKHLINTIKEVGVTTLAAIFVTLFLSVAVISIFAENRPVRVQLIKPAIIQVDTLSTPTDSARYIWQTKKYMLKYTYNN